MARLQRSHHTRPRSRHHEPPGTALNTHTTIPSRRSLLWLRTPVLAAAVAVVAGCTASDPAPPTTSADPFSAQVEQAIAEAQSAQASDAQIATLQTIAATGLVTYEQAKDAAMRGVECAQNVGLDSTYADYESPAGFAIPAFYADGGDEPEIASAWEACDLQEAFWVNKLYQLQPDFQHLHDAFDAIRLQERIDCLEQFGITVPSDATWDEVATEIASLPTDQSLTCRTAGVG